MKIPINIIPSHEIDITKWDACVAENDAGLIYVQYHYLNTVCTNWSAIVIGNYQAIMPLPWRKKIGLTYFYAPAFVQQLGLIGNIDGLTSKEIFKSIRSFTNFGDLLFNFKNEWIISNHIYHPKNNYTIQLLQGYHSIASKYSKDLVQNLQKAEKYNFTYLHETNISNAIELFELYYGNRFKHIKASDFKNIETLCLKYQEQQQCIVRTIKNNVTGNVLATALLLKDNRRLYLLMNTTTNYGRKLSANHLLIDKILQEFSGQNLLFDFEGSNLDGVKTFYENYHPENQPYFHFQIGALTRIKHQIKQFTI